MRRLLLLAVLILLGAAVVRAGIEPINCISGVVAGTGETVTQSGSSVTVGLSPTDTQAETFTGAVTLTSSETVNSNFSVTGQINAPLTVTSSATYTSNLETDGFLQLFSRTKAQIGAITPAVVGQMYYCSDCTALRTCISTGTIIGSFASPVAVTTACN